MNIQKNKLTGYRNRLVISKGRNKGFMKDYLENWAEKLTEEVYQAWKSEYSFWKLGFALFYSPVHMNPKIMIIGRNPGGRFGFLNANE